MAKRRVSEVELCFDSMTDLITNLAGGLVLVVLLLVGLTREAPPAPTPTPSPGKPREGEKSPAVLYKRVLLLHAAIKQAEGDIARDRAEVKQLDQRVAALLASGQSPDAAGKKE
jgi:hypothetical protein